jgi:hypothetical protein
MQGPTVSFILDSVAQTRESLNSSVQQVGDIVPFTQGSSRAQQKRRKEYDLKMSVRRQTSHRSISSSNALHSHTSQLVLFDTSGYDTIEQASTEGSEVVTSKPDWIKLRPELLALSKRSKALARLRAAQQAAVSVARLRAAQQSTQTTAHVQTGLDEKSSSTFSSTSPPLSSESILAQSEILSAAAEQARIRTLVQVALDERLRANVSAPMQGNESAEVSAPAQASCSPDLRSASADLGRGYHHTSAEWGYTQDLLGCVVDPLAVDEAARSILHAMVLRTVSDHHLPS